MSATYNHVTIGTKEYPVYADLGYADEYLAAEPTADAWRAAEEEQKARALVSATRVLDLQNWQGTKTYPDDELAWPRTGVTISTGAVDPDVIPTAIVNACAELASQVLNGVDIANFVSTVQTQKRIKAGSVEIENFRLTSQQFAVYPLPQSAWLLIAPYMAGQGASASIRSQGTCNRSILDYPLRHNEGF